MRSDTTRAPRSWCAAIAVLLLLVAGCSTSQPDGVEVLEQIALTDGSFSNVVLMADGSIYYLQYTSYVSDGPQALMRRDPAGKTAEVLLPGVDGVDCSIVNAWSLSRLPDGRLGIVAPCTDPSSWADPSVRETSVYAMDTSTNDIARIGSAFGGQNAVWLPGMTESWIEREWSGCFSIAPVANSTLGPFPSYSPKDLLPWSLDAGLRPHSSCTPDDGMAGFLDTDGAGSLFFLASPESRGNDPGRTDLVRSTFRWNLYRYSIRENNLRMVADGFVRPRSVAALADGRVVVCAERGANAGLWMVDVAGTVSSLALGDFDSVSASTTRGGPVVAVRVQDDHSTVYQIVRLPT